MDSKDFELFADEQRAILQDVAKGLEALAGQVQNLSEKYVAPKDEVKVKGKLEVNTQKNVTVDNLKDIDLDSFAQKIVDAVSKNEPLDSVRVTDLRKEVTEAMREALKEVEPTDLSPLTEAIEEAIKARPQVNVTKEDVKLPNTAKDYISVRLTDGKKFYKAAETIAQAIQRLPLVQSTETGEWVLAIANADGSLIEGGTATDTTDTLLLENGDDLLLENGDELLLESN